MKHLQILGKTTKSGGIEKHVKFKHIHESKSKLIQTIQSFGKLFSSNIFEKPTSSVARISRFIYSKMLDSLETFKSLYVHFRRKNYSRVQHVQPVRKKCRKQASMRCCRYNVPYLGKPMDLRSNLIFDIYNNCTCARDIVSHFWNWEFIRAAKRANISICQLARRIILAAFKRMDKEELFIYYKIINCQETLFKYIQLFDPMYHTEIIRSHLEGLLYAPLIKVHHFISSIHTWYIVCPIVYEICYYTNGYPSNLDELIGNVENMINTITMIRHELGMKRKKFKNSQSETNLIKCKRKFENDNHK